MIRVFTIAALACVSLLTAAPVLGVTVIDDAGQRITISPPLRRVVSLAPSATEILYAAGAGNAVVGVVATSDWPPAARSLPKVGDASGLDLERIVALHPQLVVTWPYTAAAQVALLRERGIAVFVIDPRTVEDIATAIERIGALAAAGEIADKAATSLRARIAALRERYAARPALRVFYEVWPSPLVTLGGDHIVSRAMETCGGRNVFAQSKLPAPNVTMESVLAAKPEVIIAGADGAQRPDWLDAWRRWTEVPAVASDNLYAVNADYLHRPGPRFVDGVAQLCQILETARNRRGH